MVAPLSGQQAARQAAATTNGKVNDLNGNWAGVEVNDAGTNLTEAGGDATQGITAEWIVPTIVSHKYSGTASNWVGIGGGSLGGNLVQLGTQEQCVSLPSPFGSLSFGLIFYSAWWEVVGGPDTTNASHANPQGTETLISMAIHPGNLMQAEVDPAPWIGPSTYLLSMVDMSTNASFVQLLKGETGVVAAGRKNTTAEVISIEATTVNGAISALPQLSPVAVAQAQLSSAGGGVALDGHWWGARFQH